MNGDFTIEAGSQYVQTSNLIYFNGTSAQTITLSGASSFNRVHFNNGGANVKTIVGDFDVSNWLMINNGATVDGSGDHVIAGGLRVDGICNFSGSIIMRGSQIDTTDPTISAITLGTAKLIIETPTSLRHTVAGQSVAVTVQNDVVVKAAGYIVLEPNATLIGQDAYRLTLEAGRNLYIRGANNFPDGFGIYDFDPTANVVYDGSISQTVRGGFTYGRLYVRHPYVKMVDGPIKVTGYLNLVESATLDLQTYSHEFSGAIIYNGANNGSINGPDATLTISGPDTNQTIEATGTGIYTFKKLILSQNGATATRTTTFASGCNLTVTNDLTIENVEGTEAIQYIVNLNDNPIGGNGGNLSLGAHCSLYVDHLNFGSDVVDHFTSTSFHRNSTVQYNLNGGNPAATPSTIDTDKNQIIANVTYGNLALNYGNKIAAGALEIKGDILNIGYPVFYDDGFTHYISGNWKLNNGYHYTQSSATGTIVFDGENQDINGRNFNNIIIAKTGNANLISNLDIFGDITVNDGSEFNASTLDMKIGGDMLVSGTGKYTQTDGTTTFNGNVNQSITMNAASSFGNLIIDKINSEAQTVTALSDFNVGLNLTVTDMSGILDITDRNLYVGRNFRVQNNTVPNLITAGSTVIFNGSVTQDIRTYREDNLAFNHVVFQGSGDKTLTASNPGGGLIVSPNFEFNGNVTINASVVQGSDVSLYVRGNWLNNGTFNHNRTVYFDGADQNIGVSGFYHVKFQGTDTKTLTGNISVSYDLYIDGTATLNANGNSITLSRTWYNEVEGAGFEPSNGKVIFNGGHGANIYTGTTSGEKVGKNFYDIEVNKTVGGNISLQGDLFVQNDLNINTQTLNTHANSVWVGGDFVVKGTYNCNSNASLLTLNASGGSHIFDPNNALIRGLVINAPSATYQMQSGFTLVGGNMNIVAGALDLNKNQIQLNENNRKIDINGGSMIVGPASKVLFTGNQSLNLLSGALLINGEEGSTASLESTHATVGFTVNATGGTFYADHYRVQKGSIVVNGATLDATKNLSNGVFVEGRSGSSYITLTDVDLGAGISLSNMIFNSGASKNITRTSGTGTVTVLDASGAIAGAYYELDDGIPGTLIDWTFPLGLFWDGGGDGTDWHDALNWSGNTVPSGSDIVYLNHKEVSDDYTVNISTDDAASARVMIDSEGGNLINLNIGFGKTLNITEHIDIGAGTTLTQENTSVIKVGKNWTNQGTYTPNNGQVIFNATSGNYIISSGGFGAGKSFYDVEIDAGESLYTLDMPTEIQNNLTITSGTFDLASPNNHLNMGGNWKIDQGNGGRFVPNKANVTFNGNLQSIENGTFYNLIIGSTSTSTLNSNIAVENDLILNANSTLNANDRNIYVRGNWQNDNGSFTQTGFGTVIFDRESATQYIDNGTTGTVFNNITFSKSAAKTFGNDVSVNGNVLINNGSGVVNLATFNLTGIGDDNKFTNNSTLRIQGQDNFPAGFETMEMATNSWVYYYSDGPQNVYSAQYGNLSLQSITSGALASVKTALGDLEITGSLQLNDANRPATLDMTTNDANMVLTGSIAIQNTSSMNWGTGNATLEHIGGAWYIDEDISLFNHLILGGTSHKYTQGNLTITGDLIIKSGVDLRMYNTSNRNSFRTITGIASGTISMETGARILNSRPSLVVDPINGGPAIPEGFGTYDFNDNSTYFLFSDGKDQTLYTGNEIAYGHLTFSSTKDVTSDGIADLDVNGNWDMGTATYYDGGKDMYAAGPTVNFNNYVPSSADRKLVLDGLRDQRLLNSNDPLMVLPNVEFRGTGIKSIIDHTIVDGNLFVDAGVVLSTVYNITFNGANWINNGFYQQTGSGLLSFNGDIDQTVDPGTPHENNYFNFLEFNGSSTKTFVNNGADVKRNFTINSGSVNLGSLDHYFAGKIENILGGVLLSTDANIYLNGANQAVNTPGFAAKNITCSGNGTKYLRSDWHIGKNLTIESGAVLNTRLTVGSVTTDFNINLGGDWINQGAYTNYTSKVVFNGNLSPVRITSGGSNFYDVEFSPTAKVNYSLLSPVTDFRNQMNIGANAILNLNSNTLNLGANNSERTHTINGVLSVNEDAFLRVNNHPTQSILDVYGTLNMVGLDENHVATLTSLTLGNYNKTQVNIRPGATMAARYYLIENISDAGLNLMEGSTLHADNNFSDGTFLNMRNVLGARYLTLESNYSGGSISNVSFSYDGLPLQGRHYNVQRKHSSPAITFENVTGTLGNYHFEDDDELTPSFNSGLILWPEITETNWTGLVDTDWHKAGNWDNGVPTATMDAIIADKANAPFIFADHAVCKSLIITDGTLRIEDNKNIVVHDNMSLDKGVLFVNHATSSNSNITVGGNWTVNTGNFVHGNATVTFNSPNGFAYITPGSSSFYHLAFNNKVTTFKISARILNVLGHLTIYNGIVSPSTNNYTYNMHGNYLNVGGSFEVATGINGVVVLEGAGEQTVTKGTFNNLKIDGTGNKYFAGANTVEGTTEINSVMVAKTGSSIVFKGDMTINAAGTFNDGGLTHIFEGTNWRGNGAYQGDGTIRFNRTTGHQNLYTSKFNNLIVNCTAYVLYLEGDVNMRGNLTFKSGINFVDLKTSTFTSNGSGTFTAEADVIINVYGADNFPKAFASYTIDATSDTRYYGSSTQSVAGVSYGILRLNNISTKTLNGDTEVKGNLYFNNATLDVSTNNYSLTVGGHWYNNNADAGNFICREGQVVFNGADDQNINVASGRGNIFYRLTVSSAAMVTAANVTSNDFVVKSDLNVNSGIFNPNGRTIFVGGDLMANNTGTFNSNTGIYYLNKTSGNANIRFNGSSLNSITINSDATYTALDNGSLIGSLVISKGTFNGNGKRVDVGNGSTKVVTINGTYIVGAGGVLGLGSGTTCTVGQTGRIEVVGSDAGLAKVTNNSSGGRYGFVVNGEIAAEYYLFEYMSNVGIYLTSTSTIDATNHFSNGTFSNGATIGQLFRVENTQHFTEANGNHIENVSFPVHPGGSASNVAKYDASSGVLEFYNSVGVFAGENFDNDPKNLIRWTGPVQLTWNGLIDTNWNKSGNWTASSGSPIVPTTENNVFIPGGLVNYPALSISGQKTGNLTIEQGGEIRINTAAGDLNPDLDIAGDFTIKGELSTLSSNDLISVNGNWTVTSTADVTLNGKVTFNGVGGAKQIDNAGKGFYALHISGTTQYQIAQPIIIKTDLTIESGATFDVSPSSNQVTVGGNWQNSGAFLAQQGTVVLKSSPGTRSIKAGASNFYNVQINSPSTRYNLSGNMAVDEMLQIQKGILDVKTNTLRIGDGTGTDGVSISGTLLVNAGATLDMANKAVLNVNAGGSMELLGSDAANRATLTSSTAGRYSFNVNSGGSIKAGFYNVFYTDADGLHMKSGAIIDPNFNLSDGLFSNGFPGSGSYMTLMHNMATPTFTLRNLVFNAGPKYSVTRTSGTTIFQFEDASGVLGNYLFERDEEAVPSPSSGLLRWPFVKLYTWEGDVDNNWLNPNNWFDNQLPIPTSDVTIPNVGFQPVISNSQLHEMHGLTINNGATVTVQAGSKLTIHGNLITNNGLIVKNTADHLSSIITRGAVIGNTHVELTLPTNRWYYLSSPMMGPNFDHFGQENDGATIHVYRNKGWVKHSVSEPVSNPERLEGALAIYAGDPNSESTISYSGLLSSTAMSRSLTAKGYYLFGNPYPASIDWQTENGWTRDKVYGTIWYRTLIGTEMTFITYNREAPVGARAALFPKNIRWGDETAMALIPPYQSVWVYSKTSTVDTPGTLAVQPSQRLHAPAATLKSSTGEQKADVLRLMVENESSRDGAVIYFSENTTDDFDSGDSHKYFNSSVKIPEIYTRSVGQALSINGLPFFEGSLDLPLSVRNRVEGPVEMNFDLTLYRSDDIILLHDQYLDKEINLREVQQYRYEPMNLGDNHDRFVIRFNPEGYEDIPTPVLDKENSSEHLIHIVGSNGRAIVSIDRELLKGSAGKIEVFNVSGAKISEFKAVTNKTFVVLPEAPGVYLVVVKAGGKTGSKKLVR